MRPNFEKEELMPAIVQDYYTKQVLMLAYVNEESYEYMLKNNETCFYSRSRKKLWHKGEESGHIQKIKNMYLDCDKDTLLIEVEQVGVACHTGEYSCFFNVLKEDNKKYEPFVTNAIYNVIADRRVNPKEGSYTNYLFTEGLDKVCKKVGEEATEVVIAAKNSDKDDLIGEISDLAYHILVLMFEKNITIEDVKAKLSKRHMVTANKKMPNKKGEY